MAYGEYFVRSHPWSSKTKKNLRANGLILARGLVLYQDKVDRGATMLDLLDPTKVDKLLHLLETPLPEDQEWKGTAASFRLALGRLLGT
jgi:hypothetical protein